MLPENASDFLNLLLGHFKKYNIDIQKKQERRQRLLESEVTKEGILKQQGKIDKILESIKQYEAIIWPSNAEESKASNLCSSVNDERHIEFLQKLQKLL